MLFSTESNFRTGVGLGLEFGARSVTVSGAQF
jgi:hypothetical protein